MFYLSIYLVGVGIGLAVMRDRWPSRVATALLWPLGPMALVAVLGLLVVTAAILWPVPVFGAAAVAAALAWAIV